MELQDLSSALRKGFSSYKSQREKATQRLGDVRGRIDALEGEARQIQGAPGAREDFLQALQAIVTRIADRGRSNIERLVCMHADDSGRNSSHARVVAEHFRWQHLQSVIAGKSDFGFIQGALINASHPNFAMEGKFDTVSICALFEDQIKASLERSLESFPWPYPDAMPTSARFDRLAAIDAELLPLRDEEKQLQALLDEMTA